MSDDHERRIQRLEATQADVVKSLSELNTTIALLNQTVQTMASNEEKKRQLLDKGLLFVIGAFLSAFVAWVIRGGLSQ